MSDAAASLAGSGPQGAAQGAAQSTPAAIVVDASVAIKWYVPEPGAAEATAILQAGRSLLAPDLLVAELGNVLWKKVRRGELSAAEGAEIANGFAQACPVELWASGPLLQPALHIAIEFGRSVYDSLYLAVALAEGVSLVSSDERFLNALRGTPLETTVRLLGSV